MIIFYFIINATIVSTIMCLADRINHHIPLSKQRSFCFNCQHQLKWFDTLPIVSALLTLGKCRYCHYSFGLYYAIIEGSVAFWLTHVGTHPHLYITMLLLLFLSIEDQFNHTAHTWILYPWLGYLTLRYFNHLNLWLILFLSLLLIYLALFRRSLGSGDIPVILVIAVISNTERLIWILLLSSIIAIIYGKAKAKHVLPFIPIITFSFLLVTTYVDAVT